MHPALWQVCKHVASIIMHVSLEEVTPMKRLGLQVMQTCGSHFSGQLMQDASIPLSPSFINAHSTTCRSVYIYTHADSISLKHHQWVRAM